MKGIPVGTAELWQTDEGLVLDFNVHLDTSQPNLTVINDMSIYAIEGEN